MSVLQNVKTLDQIKSTSYKDSFLIGELLTTKTTFLTGEPKSGKTLLAAGMVISLVNGEADFLGLPIHNPIDRVVFGLSDDGAPEELKARLHGAVPDKSVRVFSAVETEDPSFWVDVRDYLKDVQAGLFVLDNVLGALGKGEDISSSVVAQQVANNLRIVAGAGIPILAITHSPKGSGEGLTVASSVIGGRAIAAAGRGVISLRDSGKAGKRVLTKMNRAQSDLEMRVQVRRLSEDSEVPVWSRLESKPKQIRGTDRLDNLEKVVAHIVADESKASSFNALAQEYAAQAGLSPETLRKRLKPLIMFDGSEWKRCPE